jgi:alkylhydroperoxidase/carboxymuconolactone decarboxylase family protein YurZ
MNPEILSLVRISCAVCLRRESLIERELRSSLESGIEPAKIREALLQTYLFAGYACTINAFIVFNRLVPGNSECFQEAEGSVEQWRDRGEELCRKIYGQQFDKMVENMNRLHPDLADWMIFEGYGKVLSRPFLSPAVREFLILAMTAVLNVERQFHSHVRGALHAGATPEDIHAVFTEAKPYMDPHSIRALENILEQVVARA